LIQKNNICYFGIKAFDALSTPWFVTKVIKHMSDWSRNSQTNMVLCNASLHQLSYPRPLKLSLVGSQALWFSRWLECADTLLSLMFKIRSKSRETVELSSLLGWVTQSLDGHRHKKDIKQ